MELREELARQSLPRLDHYFKYYYTSHGVKREMAQSDGKFLNPLKNGRKIMEDYRAQPPYLLPEDNKDVAHPD